MVEPPFVMLTGYLLLAEKITIMQFCGALIIVISALIVVMKKPAK